MTSETNNTQNCSNNYSVYVHIFPDGKLYIGATRQKPIYRWRRGGGYKNTQTLNKAINDAGWDNIQHIVLADGLDHATAMIMEKELIKKYKTQDPEHGYNFKNGGQSFGQHSDEFLRALKARMNGNTFSAGRKMSESHKKALADANRRRKHGKTFLGHKHTEEAKAIMSQKARERWENPEYRAKEMSHKRSMKGANNPRYGAVVSEDTRRKISEANKGKCRPSREHLERIWENNSKAIVCLNSNNEVVAQYNSIVEAAKAVEAHEANIGFCCRNKNRHCHGYLWRYKEEYYADRC